MLRSPLKILPRLLAAAALAVSATAMAADPPPMAVVDTLTDLKIDIIWTGNDTTTWTGSYWTVWLDRSFNGSNWSVSLTYMHNQGPHGELGEHPPHFLPTYTMDPGGASFASGVDDHNATYFGGPPAHANAHVWNFATWANSDASGGFTAFQVAHVPEPSTWLMMLGG